MDRNSMLYNAHAFGARAEVGKRTWHYTYRGCGSGINMIGIWWKEKTGESWLDLSEEEKRIAGDAFFSRTQDTIDWSTITIDI